MIYVDVEIDMKKMLMKLGDLNVFFRRKKIFLMGWNCYIFMIFINIVFEK